MHGAILQHHHFLSCVDTCPVADEIFFTLSLPQNFAIIHDFPVVFVFHLMRTTVGLFFCFLKMREFWIEIELTVAVPGYLAIFYVKSFTMFHLNKTVSVLILMSAITDGFTWCFVKVLFALFTTIALMIRQLLTLIYCNIIVPKFIFVCTYTRLSAWCLIESILAIFVKIAIFQRQMLTVLHNFVITTEFFLVSASRSKVSCFSRRHIVFLIENI